MSRAACLGLLLPICGASCAPNDDLVFVPLTLALSAEPLTIAEDVGLFEIPLELSASSPRPVTASYALFSGSAQENCASADFSGGSGTIVWPIGERVARVAVRILDDTLAETDETFRIVLTELDGAVAAGAAELSLSIVDNDRSGLFDARDYGAFPDLAADQTSALQAALDAAADSGRGVVSLAPGSYRVSSLSMAPATTLSGSGAVLERPPLAGADVVTLAISHAGDEDSLPVLVEGLTIDGRRSEQGEFLDYSQEAAHLLEAKADAASPGRLQLTLERVDLTAGVGDGVTLGPNVAATLCEVTGYDLWKEFLSITGGNTSLRGNALVADGSLGTTGIWLTGLDDPGYGESVSIDVELDDVLLATGDFELKLGAGSHVEVRDLTMARAALRVVAPQSTVRISDSLLMMGIASERHNHFRLPHDVVIEGSTIVLSEQVDEEPVTAELDRTLWFVDVGYRLTPDAVLETGEHRLLFDGCRFDLAEDVEATDEVYVLHSPEAGGQVSVRNSELAPGIRGWLADECSGCSIAP